MGQIEQLFYNHPAKKFHIREISRLTGIPKSTVASKIKKLIKKEIVLVDKDVFKAYRANQTSPKYNFEKKTAIQKEIFYSGLIEFLDEELLPECIVLFGSIQKGEYVENSDIDLFIQCKETVVRLDKFEKLLGRKIQLFMHPEPKKLPKRILNNILNGQIVSGYLKLF